MYFDSDGPSSASATARSARSICSGATVSPSRGGPASATIPASRRASRSRRSASSEGSHSQASSTPGQPAVVQLVAAVQRQLEVLVDERIVGCRPAGRRRVERVDRLREGGEHGGGELAAGCREAEHASNGVPPPRGLLGRKPRPASSRRRARHLRPRRRAGAERRRARPAGGRARARRRSPGARHRLEVVQQTLHAPGERALGSVAARQPAVPLDQQRLTDLERLPASKRSMSRAVQAWPRR
jgi:hypothetical protein